MLVTLRAHVWSRYPLAPGLWIIVTQKSMLAPADPHPRWRGHRTFQIAQIMDVTYAEIYAFRVKFAVLHCKLCESAIAKS